MFRIDTPGNVGGLFVPPNPLTGQQAVLVSSAWLNDVQENLIGLLTAGGVTPVKGNYGQITAAVNALIAIALASAETYAAAQAAGAQAAAEVYAAAQATGAQNNAETQAAADAAAAQAAAQVYAAAQAAGAETASEAYAKALIYDFENPQGQDIRQSASAGGTLSPSLSFSTGLGGMVYAFGAKNVAGTDTSSQNGAIYLDGSDIAGDTTSSTMSHACCRYVGPGTHTVSYIANSASVPFTVDLAFLFVPNHPSP